MRLWEGGVIKDRLYIYTRWGCLMNHLTAWLGAPYYLDYECRQDEFGVGPGSRSRVAQLFDFYADVHGRVAWGYDCRLRLAKTTEEKKDGVLLLSFGCS